MTILLPAWAVAFAAFCIWLSVRIFNRRERWAKWTLAAGVGFPVLYVLSFGPACWAVGVGTLDAEPVALLFRPIVLLTWKGPGWVAGPLYSIAGMTDIGQADGLGEIQYAAGYRDVLGGSSVYRVGDLTIPPRGGTGR